MASPGFLLAFFSVLLVLHVRAADQDGKQQDMEEDSSGKEDGDVRNTFRLFSPGSRPSSQPRPLPPSTLLRLFLLKELRQQSDPITEIDPPRQQLQQQTDSDADKDDDDEDNNNNSGIVKRVFCNGFTGCGGRHRSMSRRRRILGKGLIPVLVKRPLCDIFACRPVAKVPEAFSGARLLAHNFKAAAAAGGKEMSGHETASDKKVLCKGYDGCRAGKRSLFSPWMSKMNSVADGRR